MRLILSSPVPSVPVFLSQGSFYHGYIIGRFAPATSSFVTYSGRLATSPRAYREGYILPLLRLRHVAPVHAKRFHCSIGH
jgi:hypothetical protein